MIFRYPGSKAGLLDELFYLIPGVDTFADAFVGGGSVLLEYAKRFPNAKLVVGEADSRIRAVWSLLGAGTIQELCRRVESTPASVDRFLAEQSATATDIVGLAFQAIYLNRCAFGGILASGPIGGVKQKSEWSVGCRYNSNRLVRDIEGASKLLAGRLTVVSDYRQADADFVYYDPPYVEKGDGLYGCKFDHTSFALHVLQRHKPWLVSYDQHPQVEDYFASCTFHSIVVSNRNAKTKKVEYLISP